MPDPVQVTFIGGPADLQRRVLPGSPNPPSTWRIPLLDHRNLAVVNGREFVNVEAAEYRLTHLVNGEGRDVWVAILASVQKW